MKNLKVKCSDWHLGWGYGGNDHLGKLEKIGDWTYRWTGKRQGRHGQTIQPRYSVEFLIEEGIDEQTRITILTGDGSLPQKSEVLKSIDELHHKTKSL